MTIIYKREQTETEPTETREQFLARYPRPSESRVLVRCSCGWGGCTGWAWSSREYLMPHEQIVEDQP